MDKQGLVTFNLLMWIPRIIFLVVVLITVITLVNLFATTNIQIHEAQLELFTQEIIYSPQGLAYFDLESNRVYPGIIDKKKQNITFLTNQKIAARITIENNTLYYPDEKSYKRLAPLEGRGGPGGVEAKEKSLYILLKDDNNITPEIMNIKTIVRR